MSLSREDQLRLAALRAYYEYEGPPIVIQDLAIGGELLQIHYTADPGKRSDEWVAEASKGSSPEKWAREMELLRASSSGDRVIKTFNRRMHLPPEIKELPPVYSDSVFVAGWDTGTNTLHPAFYLNQYTKDGQVIGMGEVDGTTGMTIELFGERVMHWLAYYYPQITSIFHAADPACKVRSGTDGRNARAVLYEMFGFYVRPMTNVLSIRLGAVNWLFTDYITEQSEFTDEAEDMVRTMVTPRCVICEDLSPMLIAGFEGKYRFTPLPKGKDAEDPDLRERSKPVKNKWSATQDAFQYSAIAIRKLHESGGLIDLDEVESWHV